MNGEGVIMNLLTAESGVVLLNFIRKNRIGRRNARRFYFAETVVCVFTKFD